MALQFLNLGSTSRRRADDVPFGRIHRDSDRRNIGSVDPSPGPRAATPAVGRPPASWASLGVRARAWRIVHAVWSVAQLTALVTVFRSVASRRRGPRLWACVAFLVLEGAGLLAGRGDCPMGRVQEQWGDPTPFFELVLPPRAAKAAVPVLAAVAVAALLGVAFRPPGLRWRA